MSILDLMSADIAAQRGRGRADFLVKWSVEKRAGRRRRAKTARPQCPVCERGGRRIGVQYSHLLHRLFERAGHLKFSPAVYFPCQVPLARNSSARAPMTSMGSPVQVLARPQEDHLPLKAFSISSIGHEAGHAMKFPLRTAGNAFTHRAQVDNAAAGLPAARKALTEKVVRQKFGLLQRAPNTVPV